MRDIIFRGKRVDNGEWVEGCCAKFTVCIDNSSEERTVIIPNNVPVSYSESASCFTVIPETISEFTGLCDKNGKKIFEGDIIGNKYGKGVVISEEWNCGCCNGVYGFSILQGVDLSEHNDLEVIGNIHDNPELLKESESK